MRHETPAQGRAAVTRRFRNAVWRELPFSARRALIGTVRTLDRWENRIHRLWRSLIDSLDDSPAWLFVAIVGTIGVVLTILLFLSLSQEAQAARGSVGLAYRVIEPANLSMRRATELDSRLCLEATPLKPPPYPAEFDFQGVMLADEHVRRPPRTRTAPHPTETRPAWDDLPEPAPRQPRETRTVATRPDIGPPEFETGQPDLQLAVNWSHRRTERQLAALEPTEVSARSAIQDGETHTRLAVLGAADRDGWRWFRERFGTGQAPTAYTGNPAPALTAADEDLSTLDASAIASKTDVAFQVELHAPLHANLQQTGRSFLVIRNAGDDTIRRLELREPIQPLELLTTAEPAGELTDGILSRELRNLRRGRDRTLSMEWFPQSSGRREVTAEILGEALVAALVQVERDPEPTPDPSPPRVEDSAPTTPPRRPVVAPLPEPEPEPEPVPDAAPIIRRPPKRSTRVVTKPPRLDVQVKTEPQVVVRALTEFLIEVQNTGDTDLANIRIWVTLPPTLAHRQGSRLEYTVGTLAAGQTHPARLRVVGAQPGPAVAKIEALAADDVIANAIATLQVIDGTDRERPRAPVPAGCSCVTQVTFFSPGP